MKTEVVKLTYKAPAPKNQKVCLGCKKLFSPLGYDEYGAIGGFFCVPCIKDTKLPRSSSPV